MAEDTEVVMVSCCECATEIPEDTATMTAYDSPVCEDCAVTCERCEGISASGDSHYTVGNETWCESCWENNSSYCDRCCENYDSGITGFYDVERESWCEYCTESAASYCENCDEYYTDECSRCDDDSNTGIVHQYSHKPEPNFHGEPSNNLYMGFELEMEVNNVEIPEYREAVRKVTQLEDSEICYLKSDSSIRGTGFELVTHPHSLEAYTQADSLWNYIEDLRTNYGARSWDTDNCGLHVHVSRATFRSGAHTHRFMTLIYKNPKEMMKLAGRKNSRYASFADVYQRDEWGLPIFNLKDKIHRPDYTERMSAINVHNEHTLELRFFRGNMKREGVMTALELCHASAEYTRDLSLSDVKLGALTWDWFADWVSANNGTYPNLYQRMSKVSLINLDNRPLLNA